MSTAGVIGVRGAGRLGKIRDVLSIVGRIRRIDAPLTEAEGLRAAVELLLEFGEAVGVDWRWTDRLRRIVESEAIFTLVLAIVRYVSGLVESEATGLAGRLPGQPQAMDEALHAVCVEGWVAAEAGGDGAVEAAGLAEWLPLVVQILSLIRNIRGGLDG